MNALSQSSFVISPDQASQWTRLILYALALGALLLFVVHVQASDGAEFTTSVEKFEDWIKGNLGKLAAYTALAVGSIVAAVKKDWSWFFGALILAMGIGILAGVINASFTAVI